MKNTKREVIVVITPHIIHEDYTQFSKVIPQDSDRFDSFGNRLFLNSYRLKETDIGANAKIMAIKLYNDDLDSNGSPSLATNVGLYNGTTKYTIGGTTTEASAVIDEDCYATAITTLQAANTAGVEVAFEARNVNAIANHVWEDGGLSSDPKVPCVRKYKYFSICFKFYD